MSDTTAEGLALWCLWGEEWIVAGDAEAALEEWTEWTGDDPEDGDLAQIVRVPDDRMIWVRVPTIDAVRTRIPPTALRVDEEWYGRHGMVEAEYGATARAWIDAYPVPRYLASSNV